MRQSIFVTSLLVLFAVEAQAATFNVTRIDDPEPDACVPADCSLREAVLAANAAAGADTVVLPAGVYTLTRGVLPRVEGQSMLLQGAGSGQTRITSNEITGVTRFLGARTNAELGITGLTLAVQGGAGLTALEILNSTLLATDLVTEASGRIDIDGGSTATFRNARLERSLNNSGALLVEDSELFNVYQSGSTAQATLRRVLIDKLDPDYAFPSSVLLTTGVMTIEDSTVTHSSIAATGGALTLHRLHYLDNGSPVSIQSGASVAIDDSLFENNTARALFLDSPQSSSTISGSTFSNNRTNSEFGGGALYVGTGTTLDIRNSTFAGNTFETGIPAGTRGAAIGFAGNDAQLTLRHVTIVPPTAVPSGIHGTAIGGSGNTATLKIFNSIVRGTCALEAGVLQGISRGNIENPNNTCGLNTATNQVSVTNAALALGTLADHGGPTPTYSLNEGSVAIDNAHVLYYLSLDQRGYSRSGPSTSDIGAYEFGATIERLFADGFDG
ncbi:MAG TPA: right-handed parallel beta-helix repeat-containing protein [Dokdonella sp.]|uniref:right-handed parallel beta-helix repeat-containing protein n=1 Tax=Dokdonella sp. TaxID=2291710 RepID=UPI0025C057E7|nr:right-handed parallel beta-helix repeat-containing protein [Dokdonella sp.]MBX3691012.1 right-handed parallel beta-helix repeat-containing protein [Dokdonella sp.]HNR92616.1 right-handed parallel beta-helix repeat-containing protein [Dokdonella sp.]